MKLIKNGVLLTMEGAGFENGFVITDQDKIHSFGRLKDVPDFAFDEVFDAKGGYIIPGLVDAHSHIGLWEDSAPADSGDGNENSDAFTPHLRAIDAINPADYAFKEAATAGVTTVVSGPGSANPIGGQFAALKTVGRRIDDMVISSPCAMKIALGENPKAGARGKHLSPVTRMGTAALIREAFFKAGEYANAKTQFSENPGGVDRPPFDFKAESLARCLCGDLLVKAHAHRADDIFTALRIKKEFGLKMCIEHCTDGHLIADILKSEEVGACVGPILGDRGKSELSNMSLKTAAALNDAGVTVAIVTDHPEVPQRLLLLCAAMAAREGLGEKAALSAVTINAARLCGIDDRVGSIKKGKDADLAVFDAHPLDFNARAAAVMINGELLDLPALLKK